MQTDSLLFSAPGDHLIALGRRGSYTARYTAALPHRRSNEFLVAASDAFLPKVHLNFTQTRSGTLGSLVELETFLSAFNKPERRLLIVDSAKIPLAKSAFPLDATHFFIARYSLAGESITKKLPLGKPTKDASFLLLNASLYKVDGRPVASDSVEKITIEYRNEVEQTSLPLSTVFVHYVTRSVLLNELVQAKSVLKNTIEPGQNIQDQLIAYLLTHYGQPDDGTLQWIKQSL